MNQKTYSTKEKVIVREWKLVDFNNKVLGRGATDVASSLIGKHKPYYTPHLDCGDYVVVINAGAVDITGNKRKKKIYYRHSGFPGGFRQLTFNQMMEKDPRKVIEIAVKGMLPKNKLRDRRMSRLKVFVDGKHPYEEKFIEKKKGEDSNKSKMKNAKKTVESINRKNKK